MNQQEQENCEHLRSAHIIDDGWANKIEFTYCPKCGEKL
jgi:hypothetical protein